MRTFAGSGKPTSTKRGRKISTAAANHDSRAWWMVSVEAMSVVPSGSVRAPCPLLEYTLSLYRLHTMCKLSTCGHRTGARFLRSGRRFAYGCSAAVVLDLVQDPGANLFHGPNGTGGFNGCAHQVHYAVHGEEAQARIRVLRDLIQLVGLFGRGREGAPVLLVGEHQEAVLRI